jgi:hypothetical protein
LTTPVWYRGETINYVLTVTVDGAAYDLTTATAIELQLKAGPGSADPALASLSLAGGEIVRRTQSGTTLGQADVEIPSTWLTGVGTPAGTYYFDVVVVFPGPIRRYVVKPRKVVVRDVVNPP